MMEDPRDLVVQLNLYFLQVISQLAKNDIADAMLRFEIPREIVEGIAKLNTAEIFELSKSPTFLFDINQNSILNALKDREQGNGFRNMHDSITSIASMLKLGSDENA